MNKKYTIKTVLIGDSGVGKSSILSNYIKKQFLPDQQTTLGASFWEKKLVEDTKLFSYQFWDTAGQERYRSLCPMYLRNANIIIMVYDCNVINSQQELKKWYKEIVKSNNPFCKFVIVGNKKDLVDNFKLDDGALDLVNYLKCDHLLTSAKTGENIENLFQIIFDYGKEITNNIQSDIDDNIKINDEIFPKKCCNIF